MALNPSTSSNLEQLALNGLKWEVRHPTPKVEVRVPVEPHKNFLPLRSASREAGSFILRRDVQPPTLLTLRSERIRLCELNESKLRKWLASNHGRVGLSGDHVTVDDGDPTPGDVHV